MTREITRPNDSVKEAHYSPSSFSGWSKSDHDLLMSNKPTTVTNHGGMLDGNPLAIKSDSRASHNTGFESGPGAKIQKAELAIEPCTPTGKDPMLDPANPKSHLYDEKKFGPKPEQLKPTIPQDGIINPDDPLRGMKIYDPQILPYGGMCDPEEQKKLDLSNTPMW